MKKLESYPAEIQQEVRNTLKAYDECHIERHGKELKVCVGWCLKATYGDEEILDTFKKEEVFTETEMIENYINEFHSYPMNYKGKRDYKLMHELDDRCVDYEKRTYVVRFGRINEDGDFEITGSKTKTF